MNKKVITPVGTSLFANYFEKPRDSVTKTKYDTIKYLPVDKWNERGVASCIDIVRKKVLPWAKGKIEKEPTPEIDASAEIKSLVKILKDGEDSLEVYLLTTETVISRLAAEILQGVLHGYATDGKTMHILFNPDKDVISGLQVERKEDFIKVGMTELIKRVYEIINAYPDNVMLNITGGYKATIPYLTIMGQIHKLPLYYIFEDTEGLMLIPQIPIDISWQIFNTYWKSFTQLEHDDVVQADSLMYQFKNECSSCLEITGNLVSLNPLGRILWQRYCSQYLLFYCPDDVWEEIQRQSHIHDILKAKFHHLRIRNNKTERKNGHIVYDDGDNPYRIYYFEEKGKLYIYRTFEDHQAAENFISESFNKETIMYNSSLRKIDLCNQ